MTATILPLRPGDGAAYAPFAQGQGGQPQRQGGAQPQQLFGADYVGETPDANGEEMDPPNIVDLRKQYTDYVTLKQDEIAEARIALQYYHSKQFDRQQLEKYEARGQPAIVFNRIGRKIAGLVGVLEKLRADPKAFGRNAPDEHGAELAGQCVRYALDACAWTTNESEILRKGACTGIVVAELGLTPGDKQDPDVDLAPVDSTTFFYDPRSLKLDFDDARYMGVSKLMTQDEFEEMWPGKWGDAFDSSDDGGQTLFDFDKAYLWSQGRTKVRMIEHWYRSAGEWRFCFYAGNALLDYGVSPFYDEKGKTICRYEAFAVNVDEEGIHHGFVRALKGPQDAMNQHRSKAVWIMNTRQVKLSRAALGGDGQDIERIRTEAARPDGVLLSEEGVEGIEVIPNDTEFLRQTEYYNDAKNEIDTFGPNPALVAQGGGPADVSGRSLAMQQQAGVAELGPFLSQWRGWNLRIYKHIWVAQQRTWTAERVLRITKDEQAAQYITINQNMGGVDQWGRPMLANAIGNVDVEILLDQGPQSVNVNADSYDILSTMAAKGAEIPPPVLIELSPLPRSVKDKVQGMMAQPDPAKVATMQADLANKNADTAKKGAETVSAKADAVHALALAHHETTKAHSTSTGTAIDTMQALQPPPQPAPGAPPAQ